jgi:hypothetical protein
MIPVAEALFPRDVAAVPLEEGVTMVVVVMVTCPTSLGINFLLASYVAGLITRCSMSIRDLIQITWEKRRVQMPQTLMV